MKYFFYFLLAATVAIGALYMGIRVPSTTKVFHNEALVTEALPEPEPKKEVSILAFGDMMLDRNVRKLMGEQGETYPFARILELFPGNDIVYVNLEGPVTPFPSKTIDFRNKTLQFTFATTTAPLLKRIGFTVLGLANNHTHNFGDAGLTSTKQLLIDNGLDYFGDPLNAVELSTIKEVNGMKVGFVGFHEFGSKEYTKIFDEIKRLDSTVDFLIVTPHWGVEYNPSFTKQQQTYARAFIDAGADLVLGAHPHVIEPVEIYKDKAIFYSLGNFIFDQDFSYNTMHGLAVHITLTPERVEYSLVPLAIAKAQASLTPHADYEKILGTLSKTAVASVEIQEMIKTGAFSLPFAIKERY